MFYRTNRLQNLCTSGSRTLGIVSDVISNKFSTTMASGGEKSKKEELAKKKEELAKKVKESKEKYASMSLEQKRELYKSPKYYLLNDLEIIKWSEFAKIKNLTAGSKPLYPKDGKLNETISIFGSDITQLEIDAIVNAANVSLMGGGGVDGAIHRAAGPELKQECALLEGCDTGEAKITSGYKLPAKYVIHTVGPIGEDEESLTKCYQNCIRLCLENGIRSVAFPCISTGIYGYPNKAAANVVLKTIREWIQDGDNADKLDRIIFCLFLDVDKNIYAELLPLYFPAVE